jgi:hypothetical protein
MKRTRQRRPKADALGGQPVEMRGGLFELADHVEDVVAHDK